MRSKREINKAIKALTDYPEAIQLLKWACGEEIDLPYGVELKEKTTKLSLDANREVWICESPQNPGYYFVYPTKPDFTPNRWWKKVSEKPENIIEPDKGFFDEFPSSEERLNALLEGDPYVASEDAVEYIFDNFKDYFRTRNEVEKYITGFLNYKSECIYLSPQDRKDKLIQYNIGLHSLKKVLLEKEGLNYVRNAKKNNMIYWVFKKGE